MRGLDPRIHPFSKNDGLRRNSGSPEFRRLMERHKSGKPDLSSPAMTTLSSFDHLIGAREQRERQGDAERLGGLEVKDQLDLCGKLDRQVAGRSAFENLIDVYGSPPPILGQIDPVACKSAGIDALARVED